MEFRKLKEKIAFKIRGSGKKHFIFTVHSSKIRFGLVHTSRMNIEHTRLILPAHFVSSLTINGAKVFIGFNPEKK